MYRGRCHIHAPELEKASADASAAAPTTVIYRLCPEVLDESAQNAVNTLTFFFSTKILV